MHEHTPKPPACHTHACPRTRRHRRQGSGRRARRHGSRRRGFGHISLHVGPRGPSTLQCQRQDVWRQDVLARRHNSRRRAQGLFSEIFPKIGALVKFFRRKGQKAKKKKSRRGTSVTDRRRPRMHSTSTLLCAGPGLLEETLKQFLIFTVDLLGNAGGR
jgi:hypothetical protein